VETTYIVSAGRTAIGSFGGSLKDFAPSDLASKVLTEVIRRAKISPEKVQHVVLGQVIQTTPKDAYLARVAGRSAGIPDQAPALTLNRLCGSGLQAVISGAQMIALKECEVAVTGGVEVMSRSPHVAQGIRFGTRMGTVPLVDAMAEILTDPFEGCHMGVTAENIASQYNISRETQDALAAESQVRAARAQAEGRFDEQIVPIEVVSSIGARVFDRDECIRHDVSLAAMATLRPVFKDKGSVTAANSSAISDGAAALVIASENAVKESGLSPLARIVAWGHAGVDPRMMGIGPVDAVPIALKRAALSIDQMDVIESNEAFAAQACAVATELKFSPEKVNPNGSGISLGHPVGATGAILTVKAAYELARVGGRYGLITMCIGGGQGIAMVIESVLPSRT